MTGATIGPEARAWLDSLIPDLLDNKQLESIVAYTDGHILRDVPEMDTPALRANLHASTLALGRIMLPNLATGATPTELPDEAYVLAESIAHNGMDLRVLLRIYRSGQQAMIRVLTDQISLASLDADATRELVRHAAGCVTDWAGTCVEQLSPTFATQHAPDQPGRFARRRETVRAIVSGSVIDPAVAELRLGYCLDDVHLAYLLWLDDDAPGSLADLERAAQRIAAQLDARGSFALAGGSRTVWAWARTNRCATPELSGLAAAGSMRLAFGLPAPGLAGFRRSHLESLAAQRIQRMRRRTGRVVLYDSVELDYLVSQDDEAMHAFVERELSALSGPGAALARLRETLGCYLERMCSVESTARELGIHRNTVRYRLERIEHLLGHPIEARRLELEVALRCAASLGIDESARDTGPG